MLYARSGISVTAVKGACYGAKVLGDECPDALNAAGSLTLSVLRRLSRYPRTSTRAVKP